MRLLTHYIYRYRDREIAIDVKPYPRRTWLGGFAIDGGTFSRCDGRPLGSFEIAMAQAKQCAEMHVDAILKN